MKMKKMGQMVSGVVASMLCASAFAGAPNVLVLGVDSDGLSGDLMGTGKLGSVSFYNPNFGLPSLSSLQGYNAVLVFTNSAPNDPVGLGDLLKDYADAGGGVVINTYAFSSPWAIGGGITGAGYAPLVASGSNGDVSGKLVQVAPSAIFNGVDLSALTYFHNDNYGQPGLAAGATLLATDGAGVNMIAVNGNGRIIANNTFPNYGPSFGTNAEYYKLTANELVAVSAVPEPASYAMLLAGLGAVAFGAKRRKA